MNKVWPLRSSGSRGIGRDHYTLEESGARRSARVLSMGRTWQGYPRVVAFELSFEGLEGFFFSFFFIHLCIYLFFWLHWVFVAVRGLSLVAASRGYSSLWCTGFSSRWLLLLWSTGSRRVGFSSCGTQAQYLWLSGSRAQAQ